MKNKKFSDYGEKRIISEIIKPLFKYDKDFGLGDDAAIINFGNFSILATTDKIPEDLIAFKLGLMTPEEHGRYLIAVNVSDIAAMGGNPIGILLNLSFPKYSDIEYFKYFLEGIKKASMEFSVPIVGGDTKWGSVPSLTATCIGISKKGRELRRSTAKVGDILCVSGEIGLFSTALIYFTFAKPKGLILSDKEESILKRKLVYPIPQIELGKLLAKSQACTSCMDITDGVGQSINELSESSNVSYEIDESKIPCNKITYKLAKKIGCDWIDIALGVGLDLELLFTINAQHVNRIDKLKSIIPIGTVVKRNKSILVREKSTVDLNTYGGWEHFVDLMPIEIVLNKAKLSKNDKKPK
jgi:thiamine-monophosphate kinase